MSFELQVELAGPCLYLVHPDGKQIAVLIPDCRASTGIEFHRDSKNAEPHVGYIRLDLADLGLPVPGPKDDEPRYELVHRFDRQVVTFVGEREPEEEHEGRIRGELAFPNFDEVAPALRPLPGLFGDQPPDALLMRMVLDGGELESTVTDETWLFSPVLNRRAPPEPSRFASFVTWKRRFRGDSLAVRVTNFGSEAPEAEFPMRNIPDEAVIRVKIANLCCENPLEWNDLPLRQLRGDDEDFKWVYRLLEPPETTWDELIREIKLLPMPQRTGVNAHTGSDDCLPGQKPFQFP